MKKKYIVQAIEGVDGIELASDSPVNRRVYGPGDVIELDDKIHNVAGIMARGQIVAAIEEAATIEPEAKKN